MHLDHSELKVTRWLKDELKGCRTVLDLGCGQSSLLQYVGGINYSVGVEYWQPYIDESKSRRIHSTYKQADITTVSFGASEFDAVILVDVLEHISKLTAYQLLQKMETWAAKKVIVVVPNGDMPQEDPYGDGNEKQRHVSEWSPAELQQIGYSVRGFGGWKPLRGDGANIIPTKTQAGHYALSILSAVSEPLVMNHPEYAFHLFGVLEK
jgi:SAM-dependent methyltransferase